MKLGFGKSGEKKAAKFLQKNGYEIIDKNYRSKFGEIDIIAEKDGVTVFVEVKTRSSERFGYGYEAVTFQKQEKLLKTAQFYFSIHGEKEARFDVISIDGDKIEHIENAF